jgi:Family of unknown function (DUF6498)
LYWVENIVGSLAMAVRISEHRRLTGDKEHRHAHLGLTFTTSSGRGPDKPVRFKSFLSEFFTGSMMFGIGHGAFLFVVLAAVVERPDFAALKEGAMAIVLCHAIAITVDLFTIQNWPFDKLKEQAGSLMGRTILVQLALIGGTWLAIYRDSKESFFTVFVWLKAASDLAAMLTSVPGTTPPAVALEGNAKSVTKRKKRNQ